MNKLQLPGGVCMHGLSDEEVIKIKEDVMDLCADISEKKEIEELNQEIKDYGYALRSTEYDVQDVAKVTKWKVNLYFKMYGIKNYSDPEYAGLLEEDDTWYERINRILCKLREMEDDFEEGAELSGESQWRSGDYDNPTLIPATEYFYMYTRNDRVTVPKDREVFFVDYETEKPCTLEWDQEKEKFKMTTEDSDEVDFIDEEDTVDGIWFEMDEC